MSRVIVPDAPAGDGKYLVRHPQATQCSPHQAPRMLEVLWGYTNGMKAPAKLWTLRSALAASSAAISLAFHSCFCSDVQAGRAADGGAFGGAGAVTIRLCRGALLLLGRLGKVGTLQGWFMSTGPHCATHAWGHVQMGALPWGLGSV